MGERPAVTEQAVRAALADAYGIQARLDRLPGENLNYLVTATAGHRYIAKIAGDQQPPAFVGLEQAALRHAASVHLPISLPSIQENRFGNLETVIQCADNCCKRLRLLTFIEGISWSECTDISTDLRLDLGRKLALFDQAMQGFEHPNAHRTHRWDLSRLDPHRDRIALVDQPDKGALLSWAFAQWTNHASPVLAALPAQFIHGDANPENILVQNGRVTGLVDFGDCCWNPVVCELAICLAYQMMDVDDPWPVAAPVIAGFSEVLPLGEPERRILPALICGRLANTLCVAAERSRLGTRHPNWFVSEPSAWRLLEQMREAGAAGL